jgi:hypothetical protein
LGLTLGCGGGGAHSPVELTPASVDLTIDAASLRDSLLIDDRQFFSSDCAIAQGTIDGPGLHRLLRFDTVVENLGAEDLVVGDPASPVPPFQPSDFSPSPCESGEVEFTGFGSFELRRLDGSVAASGHKESFCLGDDQLVVAGGPSHFDCGYQGISSGWADVYDRSLDGQWIDITGLPEGYYLLVVSVNTEGRFFEASDLQPDTVSVPVHVPDPSRPPP